MRIDQLYDVVNERYFPPGTSNPEARVAAHFGLARADVTAASASLKAWRDTLDEELDPAVLLAALGARPPLERALALWFLDATPEEPVDPWLEPLRVAALQRRADDEIERTEDPEALLALFARLCAAPDPWSRAEAAGRAWDWADWLEMSPAQRERFLALYGALARDPDERVRAAAAWFSRGERPAPPVDDPSPLVRVFHPAATEAQLFDLARHPDLGVAAWVACHPNASSSRRALLVVAYRLRVACGPYVPAEGVRVHCEHELSMVASIGDAEALTREPNYWWPDELVEEAREVELEYEWFAPSGLVSAVARIRSRGDEGFSAAELLYAVLRHLYEHEREGRPHFEGDRDGLGKQRCLYLLAKADGRWHAALRK